MEKSMLMIKVLKSEATEAESIELQEWIDESISNRQEFEDVKLLWEAELDGEHLVTKSSGSEAAFDRFEATIGHLRRRDKMRKSITPFMVILGVILLTTIIAAVWIYARSETRNNSRRKAELLVFDGSQLSTAVRRLENAFDISIAVENQETLECHIYATVYSDGSPDTVLQNIVSSLGLTVSVTGPGTFTIQGSGCKI